MMVYLERLFRESEEEVREEERLQSQQAAQIAAGEIITLSQFEVQNFSVDLSMIAGPMGGGGGPLSGLDFDAEFAFSDVMNSDPMLTFEPGIT